MENATDKQKKFMDDLSINYSPNITKQEAKGLIEAKIGSGDQHYPKAQPSKEVLSVKPTSLMDDRSKSIVAQCLTKCCFQVKVPESFMMVLDAYNWFYDNL